MTLPPADVLSLSGMGFVGAFGLWKAKLGPIVHRFARAPGNT